MGTVLIIRNFTSIFSIRFNLSNDGHRKLRPRLDDQVDSVCFVMCAVHAVWTTTCTDLPPRYTFIFTTVDSLSESANRCRLGAKSAKLLPLTLKWTRVSAPISGVFKQLSCFLVRSVRCRIACARDQPLGMKTPARPRMIILPVRSNSQVTYLSSRRNFERRQSLRHSDANPISPEERIFSFVNMATILCESSECVFVRVYVFYRDSRVLVFPSRSV